MSQAKLQAPRGTSDVLPADAERRLRLRASAEDLLGRAGYDPFETPVFEDTELFARGVGESTDIVQKEMFTFEDKAGRSLTLRPEATAGICRAYIEHGMHKLPQPVKVWETGAFFRHEAPQAGRYRQFTQIDAEALGSDDPTLDAELILLFEEILERAGTGPRRLRLSSLGTRDTRADYVDELKRFLRSREGELSEEVRARIDQNPLRAFDADDPGTQTAMRDAPLLIDRLAPEDAEHFAEVRALLDSGGIEYEVDPTLVRGLDYYTRTVFEFTSDALGAQSGVGGGGRYDGLIEQLGGPPMPGVGWAAGVEHEVDGTLVRGLDYYTRTVFSFECDRLGAQSEIAGGGRYDGLIELLGGPATPAAGWACGIERVLLALDAHGGTPPVEVFVVAPEGQRERALGLAFELRRAGVAADLDLAGRSVKGQMKQADRSGADLAVILDENGDALARDMESGEQRPVDIARIVEELA